MPLNTTNIFQLIIGFTLLRLSMDFWKALLLKLLVIIDNEITDRKESRTANSTYPKGGVLCYKYRFVVTGTFVLLINICGESPALRLVAKRYRQA